MAIRIFRCASCGHKMRLSGQVCNACYTEKRTYQKPQTVWLIVIVLIVGLCALAVAVF